MGRLPQAFDAHNAAWAKEYEELKGLLSAEDYEQAKASTLSAFYTPQEVIAGMYDILQRFACMAGTVFWNPQWERGISLPICPPRSQKRTAVWRRA